MASDMLTTIIAVSPPFDFHLTASQQTYFRGAAGADLYADGVYWRALRHGDQVLVTSVTMADAANAPALAVTVHGEDATDEDLRHCADALARMLGLDVEMDGFYQVLEKDPVLREAASTLRGLRPPQTESVFEALVAAVAAQQLTGHIARLIRDGLVTTYGAPVEAMEQTLYAFPTPQALLEAGTQGLQAMKLSGRKAEYIQEICLRTLDGSLDDDRLRQMDDESATQELVKVRGVGRWTAAMTLMRALGRVNVFPAGDLALGKLISRLYFEGEPLDERQLAAFAAERWHPYQGLATTYLFAYLRQQGASATVA